MNYTTIGFLGIGLSVILLIAGYIKQHFVTKTIHPTSHDIESFDENYPKDFDLVKKYSKKVTYIILSLVILITGLGMYWAVSTIIILDAMKNYGDSGQSFTSAEHLIDRMGTVFTFAIPCVAMWIITALSLSKWKRKEGTSLTKHFIDETK